MAKKKKPLDVQKRIQLRLEALAARRQGEEHEAAGRKAQALAAYKRAMRLLEKAEQS